MEQQPVLPENNCECFCYPRMRLECVGCGSDGWYEFRGRSFPRRIECRHWHTQEFNTWVVLSQETGTTVNSPETCQEVMNLFESQEQLGQAIQWYHNELWKLEQEERE